ncbi:fatty acid cis/trans isomerase [Steroidobacter sp.]|uniref:fatty acid cis/trans isomerase n=1 Tax=Steroidobacter sp. TaxID=1978227 RepID=UPI001A44C077|nr:fatty acid cis/trans isomerase [Steroidobacter sp.]MBL8269699.1 fatty acid cis/trans isomerase [Steroidobacter sp.]
MNHRARPLRWLLIAVSLMLATGCALLAAKELDTQYGTPSAKEFTPAANSVPVSYEKDIRPLMENRCLVCHGCYDAPCQLKLDSYEGILRGGSKERVYHSARLTPAATSRLFEDAQTTAQWRERGFHAVINERRDDSDANLQAGLLARVLDLKQQNPMPDGKTLPNSFDFSLGRAEQCPRIEEFQTFADKFPQWGMPYGLPALSDKEHGKLVGWLAAGAPATGLAPLSDTQSKELTYWETLFNGDSLKHQLAARYVYEHLYLAHIYFEDKGTDTVFFKVVRSRTPPGQPIDMISTRRPYDDPGVSRVYYRLWRDPASIVAKTHMPYLLTAARRDLWRKWFIDTEYTVDSLPGYDARSASNPFATFQRIPYRSRYSFLLDEAQFTIMNFIKGPVCRGNVALDVIQDRFWVFFTSPESAVGPEFSEFLASQGENLKLPAGVESGLWSVTHWLSYAGAQRRYVQAKGDFIRANAEALQAAGLNTFWNGEGRNRNAALTVFRHYDSATVVQGLVGTQPQTAWLIDYPILERIHYLLVAGFDVYGTASHQAMTRMYMDFLRMESEMNFVGFLPIDTRKAEIDQWYRGAENDVRDYLNAYFERQALLPPFKTTTDDPKGELFTALRKRMTPILNRSNDLSSSRLSARSIAALKELDSLRGVAASIVPQVTLIHVKDRGLLTLTSNSAYTNIASMFGEADRRLVAEDSVTLANGVIGAYPNVFLDVSESDLPELVSRIQKLRSEADYSELLDRFGVRRTDPRFWPLSDQVLSSYRRTEPLTAGVLDYSRYDNR